jgi:parvulin-like peptidyl-prolyl isomerase
VRAGAVWIPLLLALTFSAGCGGKSAQGKGADPTSAGLAASEPGEQCLRDARTKRHPPEDAPERIEVRHILVRHRELARPEGATRTPAEACLRALEAIRRLEAGGDWPEVVTEFSDARSDDLGSVARDELSPTFADAAFELGSGELSYVVESDRGFHVIWRN